MLLLLSVPWTMGEAFQFPQLTIALTFIAVLRNKEQDSHEKAQKAQKTGMCSCLASLKKPHLVFVHSVPFCG